MKYIDRVYGKFEINEPVVLELIQSKSLQRLKEIDQGGYRPFWINPEANVGEYDHSRFAHSVGVYLLLKKYGASLEEQLAGLIHDVSHSAFSHCIDYILDVGSEKEHNHQDNVFEEFIKNTEIPQILEKYRFDPDYITDDSHFPLKEKNLPDLCADRIDYSFKTAVIFGELNERDKNYLLDNLAAENNNWFFKNLKSDKKYAELFLKLNTDYYSGLNSTVMFRTVGDCLRYALQKGYISEADLYQTDKFVIDKIKGYLNKDERLNLLFDRMNNKSKVINDPNDYEASVFCKSRVVDPLFKSGNELKRVSNADPKWIDIINRESIPKQYFLKFID